MTKHVSKSYPGSQHVIGQEAVVTQISQNIDVGHYCDLDNIYILSVFKCDYGVFLSRYIEVTQWPCLMLLFCEIVHVLQSAGA